MESQDAYKRFLRDGLNINIENIKEQHKKEIQKLNETIEDLTYEKQNIATENKKLIDIIYNITKGK